MRMTPPGHYIVRKRLHPHVSQSSPSPRPEAASLPDAPPKPGPSRLPPVGHLTVPTPETLDLMRCQGTRLPARRLSLSLSPSASDHLHPTSKEAFKTFAPSVSKPLITDTQIIKLRASKPKTSVAPVNTGFLTQRPGTWRRDGHPLGPAACRPLAVAGVWEEIKLLS